MQHIQRSKSSTRISSVKAFRPGIPAVGLFPKRKWIGAYRKALLASDADILGYGPEGGLPDLRQAIAQHVLENRGIECTSEQVIITAGAQHAFTLFAMTMLKSGDTIWAENPGHIAVRDSMIAQGYDVRAAPIDSEGLNLELAKETLPPFSAAFVTPSHQHPLGITTSLPRRLQLLDYARSVNGWIVEDDYDSEFNYDDRPHPALFALDRYGHVIYVGSFSKAMFPGIRLGYLICPKSHAETFSHGLSLISQNTSSITQRAMAQFFEDGSFNSHIRRMKTTYKRRRDLLREAIYDLAPGTCGVDECHAGMHLILRYSNPDINDTDLARALWDGGIECLPLSIFYFETERPPDGLLLGFACADELEITKKLTKLFEVYHQVASSIAT